MGCARHWFSRYGWPGYRLPTCARCGAPNPLWAKERAEMVNGFGEEEVAALEVPRLRGEAG